MRERSNRKEIITLLIIMLSILILLSAIGCSRRQYSNVEQQQSTVIDSIEQKSNGTLIYHTTTYLLSTESESDRIKNINRVVENIEETKTRRSGKPLAIGAVTALLLLSLIGYGYYRYRKFLKPKF